MYIYSVAYQYCTLLDFGVCNKRATDRLTLENLLKLVRDRVIFIYIQINVSVSYDMHSSITHDTGTYMPLIPEVTTDARGSGVARAGVEPIGMTLLGDPLLIKQTVSK